MSVLICRSFCYLSSVALLQGLSMRIRADICPGVRHAPHMAHAPAFPAGFIWDVTFIPQKVLSMVMSPVRWARSLAIINCNPSTSCTSSFFFGSSRARRSCGPPHPPPRIILTGEESLSVKNLSSSFFADFVTVIMIATSWSFSVFSVSIVCHYYKHWGKSCINLHQRIVKNGV
jgi:hypothetical protein